MYFDESCFDESYFDAACFDESYFVEVCFDEACFDATCFYESYFYESYFDKACFGAAYFEHIGYFTLLYACFFSKAFTLLQSAVLHYAIKQKPHGKSRAVRL